jgi:hypothetical protein
MFLVKWGCRNRPHARRELKSGHVVPTHPPVTTVGHLPRKKIPRQTYPYVLILSYSYAGRRIRSRYTHIIMRVDHTSLGRGHFIAQIHQSGEPQNCLVSWPVLADFGRGVFWPLSYYEQTFGLFGKISEISRNLCDFFQKVWISFKIDVHACLGAHPSILHEIRKSWKNFRLDPWKLH